MAAVAHDCTCCGAENYRDCDCPWHRPFDDWPRQKLSLLLRWLNKQPLPGS